MEIFGYLAALIIGLTLGLIGGGGSILTVPILVYLLDTDPVIATAYSLFVVGTTALIGAYSFFKRDLVNIKVAVVFAIPSFIAVWLTRAFLLPAIPEVMYTTESFEVSRGFFIMILFSLLMLIASFSMIGKKKPPKKKNAKKNYLVILLEGIVVGVLTGLVGAGGGFLIIPALVLFGGLKMKMAVGTSLLIIAVKSLIGFTGDMAAGQPIEWSFLIFFTVIAVLGIFIGSRLSTRIDGRKLKQAFGYFVLVMSIMILIKELGFI